MKVHEKCDRKVLFEGRSNGMAFGFLKKVSNDEYHTVQPLSPCKDYLNEVVFTENNDVPTRGCGLNYPKKNNIFDDYGYLSIKILSTKNGEYYYTKDKNQDIKLLNDNHKVIESTINDIEKALDFQLRTEISLAEDDYVLVKIPNNWLNSTHSISLYTFLLRILFCCNNKPEDIFTYMDSYTYSNQDKSMIQSIKFALEKVFENKILPEQQYPEDKTIISNINRWSPHNLGIMSWASIQRNKNTNKKL